MDGVDGPELEVRDPKKKVGKAAKGDKGAAGEVGTSAVAEPGAAKYDGAEPKTTKKDTLSYLPGLLSRSNVAQAFPVSVHKRASKIILHQPRITSKPSTKSS